VTDKVKQRFLKEELCFRIDPDASYAQPMGSEDQTTKRVRRKAAAGNFPERLRNSSKVSLAPGYGDPSAVI
jgi:hypothetical protein